MFKKIFLLWLIAGMLEVFIIPLAGCCRDARCYTYIGMRLSTIDNGGLHQKELTGPAEVYATALLIRINMLDSTVICGHMQPSFIQAANAMTKCRSRYNEEPVSYKLFSDHNYDPSHPAGTDLSDLCRRKGYEYYVMAAPADTGTHVFTVKVTIRNDSTFEAHTQPLKLLK